MGDSGYTILRPLEEKGKFKQIFRSKEQQYSFNFPYQCGTGAELPYNAEDNRHKVQDGDIIVMASDGMYDNLFDEDVMYCAEPKQHELHQPFSHKKVCECLAQMALKLGDLKGYRSPFSIGAQAAGRNYPDMGKSDDIVVIVATVHKKADKKGAYQPVSTNAIDTDGKLRKEQEDLAKRAPGLQQEKSVDEEIQKRIDE